MFPGGTVYFTAQQVIVCATSFLYHILLFRILNLADESRDAIVLLGVPRRASQQAEQGYV